MPLSYCKVTLYSGMEHTFPIEDFQKILAAMRADLKFKMANHSGATPVGDPPDVVLSLETMEGCKFAFRAEDVMAVLTSTPETREIWHRNHQKMHREQNELKARLSDPVEQL